MSRGLGDVYKRQDEILPTVGEYMDAEEGEYEYKRICQNWRR